VVVKLYIVGTYETALLEPFFGVGLLMVLLWDQKQDRSKPVLLPPNDLRSQGSCFHSRWSDREGQIVRVPTARVCRARLGRGHSSTDDVVKPILGEQSAPEHQPGVDE